MALKTSVYLSTVLDARRRKAGVPLAELIRRGLDVTEHGAPLDAATHRQILREELAALPLVAPLSQAMRAPQARYEPDGMTSEPFEDIP